MQRELYRHQLKGHVMVTKGYDLKCKEVFHTFDMSTGEVGHDSNISKRGKY